MFENTTAGARRPALTTSDLEAMGLPALHGLAALLQAAVAQAEVVARDRPRARFSLRFAAEFDEVGEVAVVADAVTFSGLASEAEVRSRALSNLRAVGFDQHIVVQRDVPVQFLDDLFPAPVAVAPVVPDGAPVEVINDPVPAGGPAPAVEPPAAVLHSPSPGVAEVVATFAPLWPATPLGQYLRGLDRRLWTVEADHAVAEARVLRLSPDELRATLAEIGLTGKTIDGARALDGAKGRLAVLTDKGEWPVADVHDVLSAVMAEMPAESGE